MPSCLKFRGRYTDLSYGARFCLLPLGRLGNSGDGIPNPAKFRGQLPNYGWLIAQRTRREFGYCPQIPILLS